MKRLALYLGLLSLPVQAALPSASFSLDTRYFAGQAANEAVGTFGLQYHEGLFRLYHLAEPKSWEWRLLYFLGTTWALGELGLESSWFLSFHEYGHASRADALDAPRTYVAFDDSRYQDFLPYFARNLFGRARSGSVAFDGTGLQTRDIFVAFAAGMNNSSYFGELIDAQVRGPASSFMYLRPYLQHRLDAFEYASLGGNDIDVVLQYYQGFKGYDIDKGDVKTGSLISLFASNTFWACLRGLQGIVRDEGAGAPPIQIGQVELPNFSFYLTSQGLSLKGTVGWNVPAFARFVPGLEVVYRGETRFEPSLQAQWDLGEWKLAARATVSKGYVLGGGVRRHWGPWFGGAGVRLYHGDTLEGERLSPHLKATNAVQGWATAGFTY